MLARVCGSHTVEAYSSRGRTRVWSRAVDLDVSPEESQGLIRLGCDVLDVGVPPEIFGHGDRQVLDRLYMFRGVSMLV